MRALRQILLVLVALPVMNGKTHTVTAGGVPDTSGVLRLLNRGGGHACPVDGQILATGHQLESWQPFRWSDGKGNEGIADPERTDKCADLGSLKLRSGSVNYYERATKAPVVGDRLWLLGFDTSSKSKAFAPRVVDAKVVRVIAGHLFLDDFGKPGSSGSCVFNESGEVVGINSGGNHLDGDVAIVGRVVGIYGDWLSSCTEAQ
jgi:hypothetical protein